MDNEARYERSYARNLLANVHHCTLAIAHGPSHPGNREEGKGVTETGGFVMSKGSKSCGLNLLK